VVLFPPVMGLGWLIVVLHAVALCAAHDSFCGHETVKQKFVRTHVKYKSDSALLRRAAHTRALSGTEPIRIVLNYTLFDQDVTNATIRNYYKNTVFPRALNYFTTTLKVEPVVGNLHYSKYGCDSRWVSGPNKGYCVSGDPKTQTCGFMTIPDSMYPPGDKYCTSGVDTGTCSPLPSGDGVANADLYLYVSGRSCDSSSTLAYASHCAQDQKDRPVVGLINMCSQHNSYKGTEAKILEDVSLVIHEMTHSLVFSSNLYPFFRNSSGEPRTPRDSNGSPPSVDGRPVASTNTVATFTERGHTVTKIVTEKVVAAFAEHFNCSTANGGELEDSGGSGTSGAHWEMRNLRGEYMNGATTEYENVYSKMTLALFEDSGWYEVNYTSAQVLKWGNGGGCTMFNGSCLIPGPTPVPSSKWFCADSSEGCTYDRSAHGLCYVATFSAALPSYYQYWTNDPTKGGGNAAVMDYCPSVGAYSNGNCGVVANTPTQNARGQAYGSTSMCFKSSLLSTSYVYNDQSAFKFACYESQCTGAGVLQIRPVGVSAWTDCGDATVLSFSGFNGNLTCPDSTETRLICPTAAKLSITTAASGGVVGAPFTTQPVITVLGSSGTTATTSSAVVTVAASGTATGTLTGTLSVAAVSGVATFTGVGYTRAETIALTYTAPLMTGVTQTGVVVAVGSPAKLTVTVAAAGASGGKVFAVQPVVAVQDAGGNTVTSDTRTVTASADGSGALSGDLTLAAVAGVASFTSLTYSAPAAITLTYAASGVSSATQSLTVDMGPPAALVVKVAAAGAVGGAAFTTQPAIEAHDAGGNVQTTSTAVVTLSANGTGTLSGVTEKALATGVATFSGLSYDKAQTLLLNYTGFGLFVTQSLVVTVGPAAKLSLQTAAAGAVGGAAFATQPVLQVLDAGGNLVSASTAAVTVTPSGLSGSLNGTTTVSAVAGVATFTGLLFDKAGNVTLTFTSSSLVSVVQSVVVAVGAAARLSSVAHAAGVADSVFVTQPSVAVQDAGGNRVTTDSSSVVTVALTVGTATLSGTTQATASSGVATFSGLKYNAEATIVLTFSSGSLAAVNQTVHVLAQGSAAKLAVLTSAAGAQAGAAFSTQPVIELQDVTSARVTLDSSTVVTVAISGSASITGTTQVTSASGLATFSGLRVDDSGTFTLTYSATDLASTTQSITVASGQASKLAVSVLAAGGSGGTAFGTQPVVQIKDSLNNVITASTLVVTATANGAGTLSGTTQVTAVNGVASFTDLSYDKAAMITLAFSATGLTGVSQVNMVISTGPAAKNTITTLAAGASAGAAFTTQPSITITDAGGNVATSSTLEVTATATTTRSASGVGLRALSGGNKVAASGGVATFTSLSYSKSGTVTITYSAAGMTSASQSLTVAVGAPSKLALTTQAAGAAPKVPFTTQPVVAVQDTGGDTVATSTFDVTVSTLSVGTLSGLLKVTTRDGVATFSGLTWDRVGTISLTFSGTGVTAVTQAGLVVAVGSPTKLKVTTEAAGAVAGAAFTTQPVVELQDLGGSTVTSSTLPVTIASSGSGTLSGTTTVNAVAGVATFAGVGYSVGGVTISLTFSASGLTAATQSGLAVALPPPVGAKLVLTTPASGAKAGEVFATQPVLTIKSSDDRSVVTDSSTVVTATSSGLAGTLGSTSATASSGVVTFSGLTFDRAGTIQLTYSSGTLTSAAQSLSVDPGPPKALLVLSAATTAVTDVALGPQPAIAVKDKLGNTVTTDSTTVVTVSASGSGTLTDSNSLKATAASGVATFSGMAYSKAESVVLTFASGSLTSVTSKLVVSMRTCSVGMYGASCDVACAAATTCNGNGWCDTTSGACRCTSGYYGSTCNKKLAAPTVPATAVTVSSTSAASLSFGTTSGASLSIPAGGVSTDAVVSATTYAKDAVPVQSGIKGVSEIIQFGPEGLTFDKPVTAKLSFDSSSVATMQDQNGNVFPASETLRVHNYDTSTSTWTEVEGQTASSVDTSTNTVAASLTHFSMYAVMQRPPASAVASPTPSPSSDPSSGLSTNVIIGIAVGCGGGLLLSIIVTVFLCRKKKHSSSRESPSKAPPWNASVLGNDDSSRRGSYAAGTPGVGGGASAWKMPAQGDATTPNIAAVPGLNLWDKEEPPSIHVVPRSVTPDPFARRRSSAADPDLSDMSPPGFSHGPPAAGGWPSTPGPATPGAVATGDEDRYRYV